MKLDLLNDLYRAEMRHLKDLSDILCDRDLELSGHLREVPWAILRDENENGHLPYTEALVTAAHGRVDHEFAQAPINTYPFGTPTTQVFPEFLGICAGETKLRPALNAVKGYCEKARKNLPQDQSKTVMVFTDKWNGPLFQKYFELAFLRYALENNILFLFFLVSDYGVSRIPFLAKNHADLDELRRRGYNIERENPGVSGLKILQHFSPCTYECHSGTWGRYGSSSYYDLHYHFDFHSMRCSIRGGEPEQQIKKIPKAAAQKFAAAVYEFQNLPNQSYIDPTYVSDAGYCQAMVFGVNFEWREIGTDRLDQPYQNISKAFWNLIASLKEE